MPKRFSLSEEERAQRRAADREYVRQAVEALRTSEGWQQWLSTRSKFTSYSLSNQLIISLVAPDAVRVASFRKWLSLGYVVRRGETAIRIWAPSPPSKARIAEWKAAGANPEDKPRTFFKLTPVFSDLQVDVLPPPSVPQPIHCPIRQLEGDELADSIPPLILLAGEIGSTVSFEPVAGGALGFYELATRRIVIDTGMAVNQQVAVLCHELAHALLRAEPGEADVKLDYASEELVVESVAFSLLRFLGLQADGSSIPYLTAWSQTAELAVIEQTAGLTDRLCKRIEDALRPREADTVETDDDHQRAGEPPTDDSPSIASAA